MPRTPTDYSRTVIYKIVCNDLNVTDCYVGHTTDFRKRKYAHKSSCCNEKCKEYNFKIYRIIRDNGGFDNWSVIEIEKFPCVDANEARTRERYWYENLNAKMNDCCPSRTIQEYREVHKEKYQQYFSQYRKENIEYIRDLNKTYYENNKEEILKKQKLYIEKNREVINEVNRKYREEHKDKIKAKQKQTYQENIENIRQKDRERYWNNREIYLKRQQLYTEKHKEQNRARASEYYYKKKEELAILKSVEI